MRNRKVDRLLAEANPVPTPPPGRVTPAQERILAAIVAGEAEPRRRPRPRPGVGLLALASVALIAVVVGVAAVYVGARDGGVKDEVEATKPGRDVESPVTGIVQTGTPRMIHSVTRMYGTLYAGQAERRDGWLDLETGRARILVTSGGETTMQQTVGADERVRSWQGALGNADGIEDVERSSGLAENLRRLVRDPIGALVDSARIAFRRDGATFGEASQRAGEYKGRPVVVHRIEPTVDGRSSGYFFRWYMEPGNGGEPVAFERGTVDAAGREDVEQGEELLSREMLLDDDAPLDELEWAATSTPTPRR